MKLLKNILNIVEGTDLTQLPPDVMNSIQGHIRKGAQDMSKTWANALKLVHYAYDLGTGTGKLNKDGVEEEGHRQPIQRPTPQMKGAWKQYEENIQYAVQQLAKSRSMNADWRMSASTFHESVSEECCNVKVTAPNYNNTSVVDGNVNDFINSLKKQGEKYTIKVEDEEEGKLVTFWNQGNIRENIKVLVSPK